MSGINSHVTKLLDKFQNNARSVTWCESEYSVHDVANALKRFLREVKDGVFNGQENNDSWLKAAGEFKTAVMRDLIFNTAEKVGVTKNYSNKYWFNSLQV